MRFYADRITQGLSQTPNTNIYQHIPTTRPEVRQPSVSHPNRPAAYIPWIVRNRKPELRKAKTDSFGDFLEELLTEPCKCVQGQMCNDQFSEDCPESLQDQDIQSVTKLWPPHKCETWLETFSELRSGSPRDVSPHGAVLLARLPLADPAESKEKAVGSREYWSANSVLRAGLVIIRSYLQRRNHARATCVFL